MLFQFSLLIAIFSAQNPSCDVFTNQGGKSACIELEECFWHSQMGTCENLRDYVPGPPGSSTLPDPTALPQSTLPGTTLPQTTKRATDAEICAQQKDLRHCYSTPRECMWRRSTAECLPEYKEPDHDHYADHDHMTDHDHYDYEHPENHYGQQGGETDYEHAGNPWSNPWSNQYGQQGGEMDHNEPATESEGAEGQGGEVGAGVDCGTISSESQCSNAKPLEGVCLWDAELSECLEVEECEDFPSKEVCTGAKMPTGEVCHWVGGECDERQPVLKERRGEGQAPILTSGQHPLEDARSVGMLVGVCLFTCLTTVWCAVNQQDNFPGSMLTRAPDDDHLLATTSIP